MRYYYYMSYDENADEFFGMVDDGKAGSDPIFTIDDTDLMVQLIKTGVMKHVDDVAGLFDHMLKQDVVTADDELILVKRALY